MEAMVVSCRDVAAVKRWVHFRAKQNSFQQLTGWMEVSKPAEPPCILWKKRVKQVHSSALDAV